MDRVKEYIHRKSIERKGYRPLSPGPPSPSSSREKARYWECPGEKARYWECPGEKALKSQTCSSSLSSSSSSSSMPSKYKP